MAALGQIDDALSDVRSEIGKLDVRLGAVESGQPAHRTPVVEVSLSEDAQQRLAELIGEIGETAAQAATSAAQAQVLTATESLRHMVVAEINRLLDEAGIVAHVEVGDVDRAEPQSTELASDDVADTQPAVRTGSTAMVSALGVQGLRVADTPQPTGASAAAPSAPATAPSAPSMTADSVATNGHDDAPAPLDLDDLDDPFLEALATA